MTYDVIVVGGGPAGASAAVTLAAAGARVALVEKDPLPRYKTCGGGLVRRARRLVPVDLAPVVERECQGAELHAHESRLRLLVRRDEPIVSMTMRDRLDERLVGAACDSGTHVLPHCAVRDARFPADRVELETARGTFAARFVIAADGALSPIARAAGWPDGRSLIPALEVEAFVDEAALEQFAGVARFDLDVVPHGYAWVFPKRDHLSIGVLSMRRGAVRLTAYLERYYRLLGIDPPRREERHGSVIPIGPRRGGFARGRVLLAGDAAGFVEPITGEGISFALLSGRLAAQALLSADLDPDRAGAEYEDAVKTTILPEIWIGRFWARWLYGHPRVRDGLMRWHGPGFAETLADVFSGDTTYRAIRGNPATYLRLLRFTRRRGRAA